MRDLDFASRRVLVTGGSRGLGAVVARRFAIRGAHVFVNYARDDRAAEATCDRIRSDGGTADPVKANLLNVEEIRALVERLGEPLDCLVHAAALGSFKPTLQLKPSQWDMTLDVTARALLVAAQAASPMMPRGASIVSLSSLGGGRVLPEYGAIGIAKAAVEALTRYLGAELASRGVRVNAVAAGLIEGTSIDAHPAFASLRDAALQRTPAGALVSADAVADVVLFLCSPLAAGIVGQTIVVDGGASLLA